jgi:uncharacterized membrane protein
LLLPLRSLKHGFIFAGLLHNNSLWHGLFVYGSVISVMPESFIFWAFFCTSIVVYIIGELGKIIDLIKRWAVWRLFFFLALPT